MPKLPLLQWPARSGLVVLALAASVLSACNKAESPPAPTTAADGAAGVASAPVTPVASAPAETPAAPTAAAAPTSPAADIYTLAASGSGFSTGPMMSAHTVYVFFDTTCPHCAHLWQAAQGADPKLKFVWMPIGLLRPQSSTQGATILSAADPKAAMAENEASVLAQGPGIKVPGTLDDAALAKVKANTALFEKFNANSVPLIVFRNAQTGQVGQHAGAVDAARLREMAGL